MSAPLTRRRFTVTVYQAVDQRWRLQVNGHRSIGVHDRAAALTIARRLQRHAPKTAAQITAVTGLPPPR